MSQTSAVGLPKSARNFFDIRFGASCVPFLGDIQRLGAVAETFKVLKSKIELTQEDITSTRIDIAKWVIGMIPAALIGLICPIVGIITGALGVIALIATLAEQIALINRSTLAGRASPAPMAV